MGFTTDAEIIGREYRRYPVGLDFGSKGTMPKLASGKQLRTDGIKKIPYSVAGSFFGDFSRKREHETFP